ncbi:ATPase family gene 2 protein homolog A [Hydra vulgaris]|uniref:ATPase family gene 2 protein homolog A n=1 Tax=Hydra vulgaris TaxID=6087 RepID=UPI001F5E3AB1|nr:ATPase family protein 2 homolog [Hydra vulgaris]
MSGRKPEKPEWVLCKYCNLYFTKYIVGKHQQSCSDDSIDSLDTSRLSELFVRTAYIKDGIFSGFAKNLETLVDEKITYFKSDLVLVNPATLKCCNLPIACSVLICYQGKETYGTIWTSSAVVIDSIFLSKSHMSTLAIAENELVTISKNDSHSVLASTILFKPRDILSKNNFVNVYDLLMNKLDDSIVTKGDIVFCPFYESELSFIVVEIMCDFRTQYEKVIDNIATLSLAGSKELFTPTKSSPSKYVAYCLNKETVLKLDIEDELSVKSNLNSGHFFKLSDMGGVDVQVKLLEELVQLPFENSLLYKECGINLTHGIIFYGPSGTGKTHLANAFVNELSGVSLTKISGPEIISKYYGESEQNLKKIFMSALSQVPSILIIDEFDILCPSQNLSQNESEKRIISTLLTLMDNIPANDLFVVFAITNNLEGVELSLRRPGRFDQDIEVGVPNVQQRFNILKKLIANFKHKMGDKSIQELASLTHGYVGSDLKALCKEAGMISMKRLLLDSKCLPDRNSVNFSLSLNDFKVALSKIGPSAMKALTVDVPKVYWTDVGGQSEVKQKLREAIEWPLNHPEVFKRLGISPPRGLLMYGPPGCSKTLMAKALATESGLNFISIKGPELFNKYLGESEKAVREVFRKARNAAPSIIFFDEIDALSIQRSSNSNSVVGDRVLAQILTELDGVESLDGVVIVAATNRPDVIDPALLRPGRIDRLIYVPLPNSESRREILSIQFRSIPVANDVDINVLVELSSGYSGAEICSICREAAMFGLREDFDCVKVSQRHFLTMFNQIKPATSSETIKFFDAYACKTTGFL